MAAGDRIRETYHAAIQHDMIDLDGDEHLAGVVRRPTGWFRSTVDANYPDLGPPEDLLSETKDRHEQLKQRGMCDEGAHNAAWEEVDFEQRYREYLDESADAQSTLAALEERIRAGEAMVFVCFEGETKRCHRHILVETMESRLAGE